MNALLKKAWSEVVDPMIRRPKRVQVAALCYRTTPDDQKEILLITSRDTGRWILPKGWPIDGKDALGSALSEAWEEAGVKPGNSDAAPIGTYEYVKRLAGGEPVNCVTEVFAVEVSELAEDYPERPERQREWVSPEVAADRVDEPQLRDILREF